MPAELKDLSRRLVALERILLLFCILIVVRILWLQIKEVIPRLSSASYQQTITVTEPAPRGRILDRKGKVLADNASRFLLVRQLEIAQIAELAELRRLLTSSQMRQLEDSRYTALSKMQLGPVSELVTHSAGLTVKQALIRAYPHGRLACHALGYVRYEEAVEGELGQLQAAGLDGLEARYNRSLSGIDGKRSELISASGTRLGTISRELTQPGDDLLSSLDLDLQAVAEKELDQAAARLKDKPGRRAGGPAVVLLMDVQTGEMLVMASRPAFDPFLFTQGGQGLDKVLHDGRSPLVNRAISGLYPPASTFKLVTAAAALTYHRAWAKEKFYCSGSKTIGTLEFNCFVRTGHGLLSFDEAIALSCDSVFYDLATRLSVPELSATARKLGYGKPTGIDLPGESSGYFPDQDALKAEGKTWYAGDSANLGIGQGYVLATPLQVLVSTARLVGDAKVQPSMLAFTGPRKSAQALKKGFEPIWKGTSGAISYGTASGGFQLDDLSVAGKTGTAEAPKTEDNPLAFNHTWFVGWAPAEKPEVAVLVFFEGSGGYGGEIAAPVASSLLKAWQISLPLSE